MAKKEQPNYLDFVPCYPEGLHWSLDEGGIVVLEIDNRGIYNRIAQKIFRKPKVSYVSLDAYGTYVWQQVDGEKSVYDIARAVEAHFEEVPDSHMQRIAKYFCILETHRFMVLKK